MIRNDKELIVVGDRVLVKVDEGEERTHVGLYLPSTALESQAVQGGTIMATGPGQPMPSFDSAAGEEPWKEPARETRFVPMQARRGDYALFFRKASVEITFENRAVSGRSAGRNSGARTRIGRPSRRTFFSHRGRTDVR